MGWIAAYSVLNGWLWVARALALDEGKTVLGGLQQSIVRNRLLKTLSPEDFDLLGSHLQPMTTQWNQTLIVPHGPIRQMFFPEAGFASITTTGDDLRIEVGMVGREGLVGAAPVLLGTDQSPYEHFIQSPGEMLCIGTDELVGAVDRSPSLRKLLLRFVATLLVQTAQTAYVNASEDLDARLARWLLMCQDRADGDKVVVTHEFLSMMLGVQRTSVSLALQTLETSDLILARRGRIEILDRDALARRAGKGYGLPEAEYARLIGAA